MTLKKPRRGNVKATKTKIRAQKELRKKLFLVQWYTPADLNVNFEEIFK